MPFEAMVVTVVAMVLGYKLLSQFIAMGTQRLQHKGRPQAAPLSEEETVDMKTHADDLMRRLQTLEEIIGSEKRAS